MIGVLEILVWELYFRHVRRAVEPPPAMLEKGLKQSAIGSETCEVGKPNVGGKSPLLNELAHDSTVATAADEIVTIGNDDRLPR